MFIPGWSVASLAGRFENWSRLKRRHAARSSLEAVQAVCRHPHLQLSYLGESRVRKGLLRRSQRLGCLVQSLQHKSQRCGRHPTPRVRHTHRYQPSSFAAWAFQVHLRESHTVWARGCALRASQSGRCPPFRLRERWNVRRPPQPSTFSPHTEILCRRCVAHAVIAAPLC